MSFSVFVFILNAHSGLIPVCPASSSSKLASISQAIAALPCFIQRLTLSILHLHCSILLSFPLYPNLIFLSRLEYQFYINLQSSWITLQMLHFRHLLFYPTSFLFYVTSPEASFQAKQAEAELQSLEHPPPHHPK